MKITTFISDMGGVLISVDSLSAAKKFSKFNNLSPEDNLRILRDYNEYMLGDVTTKEFVSKEIKSMNLKITEDKFLDIYLDRFSLNEEMFSLLKKLKGNLNLIMLSNTEDITINFLMKKYPNLYSIFDKLIFSYNVHMVKPNKDMFLHTLKVAKVKPENCIFVDDKVENVEAAKRLGINSFQYTTVKGLKENLVKYRFKV